MRFPGSDRAETQISQLEYVRSGPDDPPSSMGYVDYLNHRGEKKPKAELIYRASVSEMKSEYSFMMYNASVLRDWQNWDGTGAPP